MKFRSSDVPMRSNSRAVPAIVIAVVIATCGAVSGSLAAGQASGPGSWKQFHDTRYNFALTIPTDWSVSTNQRRILITSADRASFAIIENFVPQNDETAEDHVDAMPKTEAELLPECKMTDAYTLDAPVKQQDANGGAAAVGEQAVGLITYNGEHGPGQARALCLVFPKGGLLFALAAPNQRFATDRASMIRILQSFKFTAPTTNGSNPGRSASPEGAPPTTGLVDALGDYKYVSFSDAAEHVFTVDVPQGWKTDGGMYRASVLDTRNSILVRSPHDEMAVLLGDAAIPHFTLPTQRLNFLGHPEGAVFSERDNISSVVLHYMPAIEFNRWYLTNYLGKSMDDIEIGVEQDNQDMATTMTNNANKGLPPGGARRYDASLAQTWFSGRSKLNGRQMSGTIISVCTRLIGNAQGDGNWTAKPNMCVWATGDAKADARKSAATAVYRHMMKTFVESTNWEAAERKREGDYVAMVSKQTQQAIAAMHAAMAQSVVMNRRTVQSGDDRRAKMMGDFKARMAAKDDNTRKMQNYSLDQTDVTDGSQSWKVASGYTNYYHSTTTGNIIGTNDPTNPGVGFTQLGQR